MTRLADKGWLEIEVKGRSHRFRPTRTKEEADQQALRDLANRAFGGSLSDLVRCFAKHQNVDPQEIQKLRKWLDETEEERGEGA
jgi:predicted transcriptional regulator